MSNEIKTNCIIIGSGPAGYSAAIYTARAGLKPILIKGPQPGGQLTITTEVENFPGFSSIHGPELMINMENHALKMGTEIIEDTITEVDFKTIGNFLLQGESNNYCAKTVIIATGASAKWLGIPSEKEYLGFGVSGCATCDGFFFKNKEVCVVGGGNSAITEALHLTNHASKVYLIHRRDSLRGEKILQERLINNPKVEIIWNTEVEKIIGENIENGMKFITGIELKNNISQEIHLLKINGVFIAIGHSPNTNVFKNYITTNNHGYILTKNNGVLTNIDGIFAAGDVMDMHYRQAITSAGFGCMAALEAEKFLIK